MDPLADDRISELAAERVPEIESADVARRYEVGGRAAALLSPVRAMGGNAITHAFVMFDPATERVELALWAEVNRLASFTGAPSHRLQCLRSGQRSTVVERDALARIDDFEREALEHVRKVTGGSAKRLEAPETDRAKMRRERSRALRGATATADGVARVGDEPAGARSRRSGASPAGRSLPSPVSEVASGSHHPPALWAVGAGVGGVSLVLLLISLALNGGMLGASRTARPVPFVPSEYRDGGVEGCRWDAVQGRDDSLDPVAADEREVFWVSRRDETLRAQAIAGGTTRVLAEGLYNPTAIAVAGDYVYVTCTAGSRHGRKGAVLRVAKTGGEPTDLTLVMVAVGAPVVHEEYLYFLDGLYLDGLDHPERRGCYTQLSRAPLAGGRPDAYLLNVEAVPALAVSETRVLWLPCDRPEVHVGPIGAHHPSDRPPWVIALPPVDPESAARLVHTGLDGAGQGAGGTDAGRPRAVSRFQRRPAPPTDKPTGLALAGETAFVSLESRDGLSVVYRVDPEQNEALVVFLSRRRIRELHAEQQRLWWVEEGTAPLDVSLCAAELPIALAEEALSVSAAAAPSASAAAAPSVSAAAVPSVSAATAPSAADSPARCATAAVGVSTRSRLVAEHLPRGAYFTLTPNRVYWTTGQGLAWQTKSDLPPVEPAAK